MSNPFLSRRRLGVVLAVAMVVAAGVTTWTQPSPSRPATNPAFDQLIDRYLKEVRGVGGGAAPDTMSAASIAAGLDTRRRLLKELEAFDRKTLNFDEDVDWRFLRSILRGQIIEGERVPRWQQDPRLYMATRAIEYRLDADPRPPEVRATELVALLDNLQVKLANGKLNLSQHIPRWVELSQAILDGALVVIERQVPAFAARVQGPSRQALEAAGVKTVAALKDFKAFLTTELPRKPTGDWKIGADTYNMLHEQQYLFDDNDINLRRIARGGPGFTRVPNYHDWGWRQFKVVEGDLQVQARKIDPTRTWLQIVRDMKEDHPPLEAMIFRHLEAARRAKEWVIEKDLVTIPWKDDDDIMIAAPPSWSMIQWWGLSGSVPAAARSRKSAWTMILPDPTWSDEMIDSNLTEKDYSFMNAIAPHETYPGHHLQRLYTNENPRKLRVYEGTYSNQSWCYYVEWDLTPNYGYYPKDKQELYTLEMLRLKLWRMGRVIIDSGLHTGRMSYNDAVALESERIGFVRYGGQINIDGITSGGSDTAAPTLGYFEFMLLREDYYKKMRELDQKGSLKDYHDRVYKIGWLPVPLIRETLMHQLEQEFRAK